MKVSERNKPSEQFLGAILRAYDKANTGGKPVTCSTIWDYIVFECLREYGGFTRMFEWDKSQTKSTNRIRTIAETIQGGYVPGLALSKDEVGREYVEKA